MPVGLGNISNSLIITSESSCDARDVVREVWDFQAGFS
jgi:hypothetical protein